MSEKISLDSSDIVNKMFCPIVIDLLYYNCNSICILPRNLTIFA